MAQDDKDNTPGMRYAKEHNAPQDVISDIQKTQELASTSTWWKRLLFAISSTLQEIVDASTGIGDNIAKALGAKDISPPQRDAEWFEELVNP